MSGLQFLRLTLIQVGYQHSAMFSSEGVVAARRADLTGLQHFVVLSEQRGTFFWKSNWREVACQYSRVPSECVAMNAFRRFSLLGLNAKPVTGELSDPISMYSTLS